MGQASSKLRRSTDGFSYWCQGCEEMHYVNKGWEFDGNLEAPTFSPSVLVTSGHYSPGWKGPSCWCTYNAEHPDDPSPFKCDCCHTFIKGGMVQFLGDCTHALAGQTVPLPELPPEHRDDYKPEDTMTQTDEDRQASDAADTAAPKPEAHHAAHHADAEKPAEGTSAEQEAALQAAREKAGDSQQESDDGGTDQAPTPVATSAESEQTLNAAIDKFNEAASYIHDIMPRLEALEQFVNSLKSATSGDFSFPQLVEEFKALKLKLRHTI